MFSTRDERFGGLVAKVLKGGTVNENGMSIFEAVAPSSPCQCQRSHEDEYVGNKHGHRFPSVRRLFAWAVRGRCTWMCYGLSEWLIERSERRLEVSVFQPSERARPARGS